MNRHWSAAAFMATLAVAILAYSCGGSSDPGPGRVLSQRIVGEWVSDPFESQLGMSTEALCFTSDNRVVGWHEVEGIAGRSTNKGTYVLAGTQLTLSWPNTGLSATMQVSWSGDRIVFTDSSNKSRSYKYAEKGC